MKPIMIAAFIAAFLSLTSVAWTQQEIVSLFPGYLTRIQCEGRLLLSAVGNDALVRIDAFPKELGCGVILKPNGPAGRTNLILETSTGTIERIIVVTPLTSTPESSNLIYRLKGAPQ